MTIELCHYTSLNGRKVSIALEELGRPESSAQVKPAADAERGREAGRSYADPASQRSLFGEAFARRAEREGA